MQEGLLWFDETKAAELVDSVAAAATRYRQKFGIKPTTCYLNTADLNGQTEINGIQLRSASNILRYHLWIGVEARDEKLTVLT